VSVLLRVAALWMCLCGLVRFAHATDLIATSPAPVVCGVDELPLSDVDHARVGAKTSTTAPAEIRWAALHCQFTDQAGIPVTQSFLRDLFERPQDGLFDHFDRMSQGRMAMSLPVVVDVPMGRAMSEFPTGNTSVLLEQLSEACLQAAETNVDFSDITGLAFFFNNRFSSLAYGSGYNAVLEGQTRRVPAIWLPPGTTCSNCLPSPPVYSSVVAHEIGHALNLRHDNNSDGDGNHEDNGWDYMSAPFLTTRYADILRYLPRSLHALHRLNLGWLDESHVLRLPTNFGAFEEVVSIEFDPASPGIQLVAIALPGDEQVLLTVRSPSNVDDSTLPEPVVFVHTYNPARWEPLWVFDAGVPVPGAANTDSSYFTAGESYTRDVGDLALTVSMLAADKQSYTVRVRLGVDPAVFLDGFEL
jgi:hypothetical protein